ncbi:hypothetical protein E1A91_A06G068200v1 [Gossypium mustelinum]|nr:hypothetical protein E1A91_A06G068200v1 [Gossypium mustelinum]
MAFIFIYCYKTLNFWRDFFHPVNQRVRSSFLHYQSMLRFSCRSGNMPKSSLESQILCKYYRL